MILEILENSELDKLLNSQVEKPLSIASVVDSVPTFTSVNIFSDVAAVAAVLVIVATVGGCASSANAYDAALITTAPFVAFATIAADLKVTILVAVSAIAILAAFVAITAFAVVLAIFFAVSEVATFTAVLEVAILTSVLAIAIFSETLAVTNVARFVIIIFHTNRQHVELSRII